MTWWGPIWDGRQHYSCTISYPAQCIWQSTASSGPLYFDLAQKDIFHFTCSLICVSAILQRLGVLIRPSWTDASTSFTTMVSYLALWIYRNQYLPMAHYVDYDIIEIYYHCSCLFLCVSAMLQPRRWPGEGQLIWVGRQVHIQPTYQTMSSAANMSIHRY